MPPTIFDIRQMAFGRQTGGTLQALVEAIYTAGGSGADRPREMAWARMPAGPNSAAI